MVKLRNSTDRLFSLVGFKMVERTAENTAGVEVRLIPVLSDYPLDEKVEKNTSSKPYIIGFAPSEEVRCSLSDYQYLVSTGQILGVKASSSVQAMVRELQKFQQLEDNEVIAVFSTADFRGGVLKYIYFVDKTCKLRCLNAVTFRQLVINKVIKPLNVVENGDKLKIKGISPTIERIVPKILESLYGVTRANIPSTSYKPKRFEYMEAYYYVIPEFGYLRFKTLLEPSVYEFETYEELVIPEAFSLIGTQQVYKYQAIKGLRAAYFELRKLTDEPFNKIMEVFQDDFAKNNNASSIESEYAARHREISIIEDSTSRMYYVDGRVSETVLLFSIVFENRALYDLTNGVYCYTNNNNNCVDLTDPYGQVINLRSMQFNRLKLFYPDEIIGNDLLRGIAEKGKNGAYTSLTEAAYDDTSDCIVAYLRAEPSVVGRHYQRSLEVKVGLSIPGFKLSLFEVLEYPLDVFNGINKDGIHDMVIYQKPLSAINLLSLFTSKGARGYLGPINIFDYSVYLLHEKRKLYRESETESKAKNTISDFFKPNSKADIAKLLNLLSFKATKIKPDKQVSDREVKYLSDRLGFDQMIMLWSIDLSATNYIVAYSYLYPTSLGLPAYTLIQFISSGFVASQVLVENNIDFTDAKEFAQKLRQFVQLNSIEINRDSDNEIYQESEGYSIIPVEKQEKDTNLLSRPVVVTKLQKNAIENSLLDLDTGVLFGTYPMNAFSEISYKSSGSKNIMLAQFIPLGVYVLCLILDRAPINYSSDDKCIILVASDTIDDLRKILNKVKLPSYNTSESYFTFSQYRIDTETDSILDYSVYYTKDNIVAYLAESHLLEISVPKSKIEEAVGLTLKDKIFS